MTDPPVETCAVCGTGPVEKLLFPVAVHFKGSGFYSTDYGRGGRRTQAKEAEGAGSGDKKTDASTSDKGAAEKKSSTDSGSSS
jgi:predicted nucleic acid-binding Zn ribbon protein